MGARRAVSDDGALGYTTWRLTHVGVFIHLKQSIVIGALVWASSLGFGESSNCDLKGYKEQPGLHAANVNGAVEFTWDGERGQQLRAVFAIQEGSPDRKST